MAKRKVASLESHTQTGYTDVTAKHSFFKNSELKARAFSHIYYSDSGGTYHQCLLNAALTCKDFLEVALDTLWEELDSFVPLLKMLPALQVEDSEYVLSGNVSQADRDRLQYYSRKVKFFKFTSEKIIQVHPSTYLRIGQLCSPALFPSLRHLSYSLNPNEMPIFHIFLHIASPLLDSLELYEITYAENTIIGPFLASLSSPMLRHITLCEGYLSGDISIAHFKQLRSIELFDAVAARNFVLWEALGTLPTLEDLTVVDHSPLLLHVSENSNSQSGGPRYFEALESLCVTSSIHFIRHLLNFIDSPCLKSIKIDPVILSSDKLEPEDLFTPLTIVSSKWSQSLKNLAFRLDLTMKTQALDYDVMIRLWSWPLAKLRTLNLNKSLVSLGALRRIAENCPELRHLHIQFHFDLDTSIIPFADTSSKSLHHNLEDLTVDGSHTPSISRTQTMLECQIKVARYLDLIFPYLKSIELDDRDVFWKGIRDLVHLCRDASLSRQIAAPLNKNFI